MNSKKYQPIFEVAIFSVIIYSIHKLVFFLNSANLKLNSFSFSVEIIYGFFLACSLSIIFILIKVNEKNIDNVGQVFLLVTCIKMALSYAFLYPILHSKNINVRIEKVNFFVVFALFLIIETIVTARILNNKQ